MNRVLTIIFILAIVLTSVQAHDYVPGQPQSNPILLKNGTIFTIANGTLTNSDLLFINGRITAIGSDIAPPDGCEIIDVTGMNVYPGLIVPGTRVGLIEVDAVRATNDLNEVGWFNPDVQANSAYNPDSEIIPTVRSNGITTVEVAPVGGLISGRSAVLNLDGWTREDAAEKLVAGMHLNWPSVSINHSWWERRTEEEQREAMKLQRERLHKVFNDALTYQKAKQADPMLPLDSRYEAMLPVLRGEMSLFVHANDYRQIEEAIAFCNEYNLNMVLVEGREAWKIMEELKENDIPVVYAHAHDQPFRSDDDYDMAFKMPRLLNEQGIKFSFANFHSWPTRNVPFDAGQAVAFGLDPDVALKAMTLWPAEILGVDDQIGSLEVGKKATLIVSEGDIMDYLTHGVTQMFIEGRKVDLDNKHKELYRKYMQK